MPEEKEDKKPEETFYEDIRADVETSVYVFASLEEIDMAILGKQMEQRIKKAKENCLYVICKGMEALRDSYDE